jgi:hypothetical protein
MPKEAAEQTKRQMAANNPMRRLGTPDEVAGAVRSSRSTPPTPPAPNSSSTADPHSSNAVPQLYRRTVATRCDKRPPACA